MGLTVRGLPLALFALAGLPAASGFANEPLYVKNLSPVTGLLGLPSQRDADTTVPGRFGAALLRLQFRRRAVLPLGVAAHGRGRRSASVA